MSKAGSQRHSGILLLSSSVTCLRKPEGLPHCYLINLEQDLLLACHYHRARAKGATLFLLRKRQRSRYLASRAVHPLLAPLKKVVLSALIVHRVVLVARRSYLSMLTPTASSHLREKCQSTDYQLYIAARSVPQT